MAPAVSRTLEVPETTVIAGRYRVVRPLGKGGHAQVYEVVDGASGARVALKQLSAEDAAKPMASDLFRREFTTLAQLAHPRIVRVFDYGVDVTPYYTMELLSGTPLRGQVAWRDACVLLRDVASALSLVHSRRLVHRDVTHRNVYRTDDGHAKLLDFGALAPMGTAFEIVGTPPYISPETVSEERLDARSDLFSLGALGYFLLTERHAFPARRITDLRDVWQRTVRAPSDYTADVPRSLDELILSLLSLNPIARPVSAAEVFNRLTAIAELSAAEVPEVAQAYLTTPALVGRSDAKKHFRHALSRSRHGKGTSLVLEGARGFGRSRLLSSWLLDAKLEGFVVLRADPANAESGSSGIARALLRQLKVAEPTLFGEVVAPHESLLAPLLSGDAALLPEERDENRSSRIVDALSAVLVAAAAARPTIVGVDDFERMDASSKQLLIRLSKTARKSHLLLVVALVRDTVTEAHALLRDLSSAIALSPLSRRDMHALMCSLFGEIAHVETVAEWVHRLSAGSPRTALEAASHLVDAGIARFEEGSWVLPASLADLQLPASVDQALDAKIASLGSEARGLCQALAVSSENDPLRTDEYGELVEGVTGTGLDAATGELIARSIVVSTPPFLAFSHEGLRSAARRSIDPSELARVHRRVAAAYRSSATPSLVLSAYHSLEAGDVEPAFVQGARAVHRRATISVRGSAFLRSRDGIRAFERLFEWGLSQKKPWPEVLSIGQMLLQSAPVADMSLVRHREPVIARLCIDSGLSDWRELAALGDPVERIQTAVGRAFARHEATPEPERGLPPLEALEALCGAVAGLAGVFARRLETEEVARLLPLIEPFRILSPAVSVVASMIGLTIDAMRGRDAREARVRLIDDLSSPVSGLEEVTRIGMRWLSFYYHALDDAWHGRPEASKLVIPLLGTATFAPLAWEARVVEALYQGDLEGADAARKERDLSKLARSAEVDAQLDGGFVYEAVAYEILGDVLRLKQCLPWFEERARACPEAQARYDVVLGSYHRLRGETQKALDAYRRALALAPNPQKSGDWGYITLRCMHALVDVGCPEEARELGARSLAEADAYGFVRSTRHMMALKLAIAEAAVGLKSEAAERAERTIEEATREQLSGIILVSLLRDQATVAELSGSDALLERAIVRLEQFAAHAKHPAFATKHAHLLRHAQGRGCFQVAPNVPKALVGAESTQIVAGVRAQIALCRGREQRARRALQILLDTAAAGEGFLYVFGASGMTLAASSTGREPPGCLEKSLAERLRAGIAEEETTGETTQMQSIRPMNTESRFDVVEVISESNGRCVLAALAALEPKNDVLAPIPMNIRTAVSDALIQAGDTAAIPWV